MAGIFRTPVAKLNLEREEEEGNEAGATQAEETAETGNQLPKGNVRKSIDEWEPKKAEPSKNVTPPKKDTKSTTLLKTKTAMTRRKSTEVPTTNPINPDEPKKLREAREWHKKGRTALSNSGNIKRDIKNDTQQSLDELLQIVCDLTSANLNKTYTLGARKELNKEDQQKANKEKQQLEEIIREHRECMEQNREEMERIVNAVNKNLKITEEGNKGIENILTKVTQAKKNTEDIRTDIIALKDQVEAKTYASAAATPPTKKVPELTALHSIIVTTKEGNQTGDEILDRVRKVVNAKEGDVQVDRIRKAKDRKVIIGCKTEEGRNRLKEKLKEAEELNIEDIKNKDPLIVMKDVLKHNTEEEIIAALKHQNKAIFQGLEDSENRITVAYQKPARNPHTSSIVVRVSPVLWQRLIRAEAVHIDLQRIRVADQSPLVQCSLCLGYGHSKRLCKETIPKCSHCAGPHMRTECADWLARAPPTCCNCNKAQEDNSEHNAFSTECPVRRRWDALARASIAYC